MPQLFPTFPPGRRYELSPDLLNQLLRAIERLSNLSVTPPLRLQDTGAGRILSAIVPPARLTQYLAVITDIVPTRSGIYQGYVAVNPTADARYGAARGYPDLMDGYLPATGLAGSDKTLSVEIWNLAELTTAGQTSGYPYHCLGSFINAQSVVTGTQPRAYVVAPCMLLPTDNSAAGSGSSSGASASRYSFDDRPIAVISETRPLFASVSSTSGQTCQGTICDALGNPTTGETLQWSNVTYSDPLITLPIGAVVPVQWAVAFDGAPGTTESAGSFMTFTSAVSPAKAITGVRWNDTAKALEQSTDGGITWTTIKAFSAC